VEILYLDGCPHARHALALVKALIAELGAAAEVWQVRVATEADAERLQFLGSPTVRVEGRDVDPEARGRDGYALQCRLYQHDGQLSGLPARSWIRDALHGRRHDSGNA
jgi:hypothetical protein